jgi:hypothetical protein
LSEFYAQDDDAGWGEMFSGEPEAAPEVEGTPVEAVETATVAPAEADTAEETEPEAQEVARPRNPDGTFAKAEQPDDVAAKLAALEARLAEKDRFIGQQSGEVGELRRALEERLAGLEQSVQAPQTQITHELIEDNPGYAVQLAFEQKNPAALQIAMEQWKLDDPFSAATWVTQRQMEAQQQQFESRLQALQGQLAPVQQVEEQRTFSRGVKEIEDQYGPLPDIIARAQAADIPNDVAATLYHAVENGTVDQKVGAIKTLALLSGARPSADTLTEAASAIAREQALAADRAIAEAGVVSATQTRPDPPKASVADDVWGAADVVDNARESGWNVGR